MVAISNVCKKAEQLYNQNLDKAGDFLDKHPTLYKIVLVSSHLFRSLPMYAMMVISPLPPLATGALMLAPTLLYQAGIERFCCFRFASPSLLGGMALWSAQASAVSLFAGQAFATWSASLTTIGGFIPLTAYLAYIVFLSHRDIEKRMDQLGCNKKKSCCQA